MHISKSQPTSAKFHCHYYRHLFINIIILLYTILRVLLPYWKSVNHCLISNLLYVFSIGVFLWNDTRGHI
ncbi:hypothetical protein D915_000081 [Fasciola hepatica]|uniref:Uncharacterized protein n=1 Tax=Fasciola hepatica TaxID=6192 RepID=A0A2H1CXN7_FASHE|nr:hypothetical protein D915_000081 [Fasciola hepatica]